jgi:hypothetical protein
MNRLRGADLFLLGETVEREATIKEKVHERIKTDIEGEAKVGRMKTV